MKGNDTTVVVERLNGVIMQIMPDGTKQAIKDNTDWTCLNNMADADIEAAAIADEDNPPLNEAELAKFRRVPNLKEIRKQLKMTQQHSHLF